MDENILSEYRSTESCINALSKNENKDISKTNNSEPFENCELNSSSQNDKQIKKFKHTKKTYIDMSKVKNPHHKIAIGSFPRCGNTLMRSIFENILGHYTGDDMIIDEDLDDECLLSNYDLGKESEINNAFIVKTHFPFMCFEENKFKCQGAYMIIRNPFDCFLSFFHLSKTNYHHVRLSNEELFEVNMLKEFSRFIKYIVPFYRDFHAHWLNNIVTLLPTKVFRYEDFVNQKNEKTKEIFEFLYKFKPDNAYVNNYTKNDVYEILEYEKNVLKKEAYKPNNAGNHYLSLDIGIFNEENIMYILETCWEVLDFFGYIDDLSKLNNNLISKCIKEIQEKKDYIRETSKYNNKDRDREISSTFKVKNIKEIEKISSTLIDNYDQKEDPIQRQSITINDTMEGALKCQYIKLKSYWNFQKKNYHN